MNYVSVWEFLDKLQFFKIKLGLESMALFMERLGQPQVGLPCLHIAGTNGKGSVAATLLAILSRAGYKVGVYTSPHLTSVRERFRIDQNFISREDFARHGSRIIEVLGPDQITYFE
ncbi:MAG: bifunctional folylpolyglutamate synthase/dihydrofolate synthase, partial [Desulfobulbaceae bacterium]|nr:bifunctional folylpolyglutamate synthase/dihydrofolate synthase [Desulfobulbaceae bacterium]